MWHGVKGYRNSPYGERRIGAITAIKARAPVLGGNFGVWGGLFSTFDCAVKGIRKKEDPYNASMCLYLDPSIVAHIEKTQANKNHSHSWILHWRIISNQRGKESSSNLRYRLCSPPRRHRGCRNRISANDGRKHGTRTSYASGTSTRSSRCCCVTIGIPQFSIAALPW